MKFIPVLLLCAFLSGFKIFYREAVPIYFEEYGVEILAIPKLGDTLHYNVSSKEDFKFVFFSRKGKCYCERYLNRVLYEKGYYENSIDTLKRYVSGRRSNGKTSPIEVQKYFEPLKNGKWVVYKGLKELREVYVMGVRQ